jgi:hypothetical protein
MKVLARMTGYMDCLMKEAVGIQVYPNNFNQDTTRFLWYPAATGMLEGGRAIMKVSKRRNSDG